MKEGNEMKKHLTRNLAAITAVIISLQMLLSSCGTKTATGTTTAAKKSTAQTTAVSKLVSSADGVLATDSNIRLTLKLSNGSFKKDMTAGDIILNGSFSGMTVSSVSCSGKNITIQLSGSPVKDENTGIYSDGAVSVPSAETEKDGKRIMLSASVHVYEQSAYIDASSLEYKNGTVTADLEMLTGNNTSGMTKDSVKFSNKNITVKKVKSISSSELELKLAVKGAKSTDSAAKILDGTEVTVTGDDTSSFTAGFSAAGFYPVFDYIEKSGKNFLITLELYAENGTFAKDIKASDVKYSDDFSKAKTISIKRKSDSLAELKLSVPAGNMTTEDFSMTGTVTLSKGSMINSWNTQSSSVLSNTRSYSQGSLGKLTVGEAFSAVGDFAAKLDESPFGKIKSAVGGIAGAYNSVHSALETLGIITSAHAEEMQKLNQIQNSINEVKKMIESQNLVLKQLQDNYYKQTFNAFDNKVTTLETDVTSFGLYFNDEHMKKIEFKYNGVQYKSTVTDGIVTNVPVPVYDDATNSTIIGVMNTPEDLSAKVAAGTVTEQEVKEYCDYYSALINYMRKCDKSEALKGTFSGFIVDGDNLIKAYNDLNDAMKVKYDHPLDYYYVLLNESYNFDTQTIAPYEEYRLYIETLFKKAYCYGLIFERAGGDTKGTSSAENLVTALNDFEKISASKKKTVRTDGKVYCNVTGQTYLSKMAAAGDGVDSKREHCAILPSAAAANDPYTDREGRAGGDYAQIGAAGTGSDFTDAQVAEFIKRMGSRTIDKELEIAGITPYKKVKGSTGDVKYFEDYYGSNHTWKILHYLTIKDSDTYGVALSASTSWRDHPDGDYDHRHMKTIYIKWGTNNEGSFENDWFGDNGSAEGHRYYIWWYGDGDQKFTSNFILA
jgi:hypothetical protein